MSAGRLLSPERDYAVDSDTTAQPSMCSPLDPQLQDPQEKEGSEVEGADVCAIEKDIEPRVKPLPEQQLCPKLTGVVIALCCHHRCNWPHLVGKEFFTSLGFSPVDFHIISLMSSLAVCGIRPQKTARYECATTADSDVSQQSTSNGDSCHTPGSHCDGSLGTMSTSAVTGTDDEAGHTPRGGYVPHPREEIGLKCKRLIDTARVWYLKQHGFEARLVHFVEQSTSLENVLLVAVPP